MDAEDFVGRFEIVLNSFHLTHARCSLHSFSFGFLATMVVRDPAAFMKLVKGGASDNYDDIDAPNSILPPTGTSKPEQKVVDL